jgi:hypothetical protein
MTMMTEQQREDLPKIIASVAWMIPSLTLKTGWAYLKMKKRAQKISKGVERSMVDNGVPPETARKLADEFAEGISVHKWIQAMDIPGFSGRGEKPTGK